jgi:hypothetical protein
MNWRRKTTLAVFWGYFFNYDYVSSKLRLNYQNNYHARFWRMS